MVVKEKAQYERRSVVASVSVSPLSLIGKKSMPDEQQPIVARAAHSLTRTPTHAPVHARSKRSCIAGPTRTFASDPLIVSPGFRF